MKAGSVTHCQVTDKCAGTQQQCLLWEVNAAFESRLIQFQSSGAFSSGFFTVLKKKKISLFSVMLRFFNLLFLSARQPQNPPLREPSCTSYPTTPKPSKLLAYLKSTCNLILITPSFCLHQHALLNREAQGSCLYLEAELRAGNSIFMRRTNWGLQSVMVQTERK